MSDVRSTLRFLWLEITGKCQLSCGHCYADSGPRGTHGSMTDADWRRVIDQAAELGARQVQFIGGEPTQHPALVPLARHALARGLDVEVYSNLVSLTPEHWRLFETPGVSVATSYYSSDPAEHARITAAANAHRLTTGAIGEVVKRGVPLRVGLLRVDSDQRVEDARTLLKDIGVTAVRDDGLRQIGRGERDRRRGTDQLCGGCGDGVAAVSPSGDVWPCVLSRWLVVGNVRQRSLADILTGPEMTDTRARLEAAFAGMPVPRLDDCEPRESCQPVNCSPRTEPRRCAPVQPCNPECGPKS